MVACVYYVNKHHDLEKLKPDDQIREMKPEEVEKEGPYILSPKHHPSSPSFHCTRFNGATTSHFLHASR